MLFLQTTNDLKEIVSTNDATVTGILIAILLAFGAVIVYLYKNVQQLNKDFIAELKNNNETLLKVNNSYNEYAKNILDVMNNNQKK